MHEGNRILAIPPEKLTYIIEKAREFDAEVPSDAEEGSNAAVVSQVDLERELAIIRDAGAENCAGVFGLDSMMWRIDKEVATFLGAGRALLLQLAHPWVAAAIAQHSRVLADPIGRFHGTFNLMFTMVFGTTEQALAAARQLHRRHAHVSGSLGEAAGSFAAGSRYRANDIAALRWVHATLIDTALVAHELVQPPLSAEDRERYWGEARLFAAFFGIPQDALPPSWVDFARYNENMWRSKVLTVSDEARKIAGAVLSGAGRPVVTARVPVLQVLLGQGEGDGGRRPGGVGGTFPIASPTPSRRAG